MRTTAANSGLLEKKGPADLWGLLHEGLRVGSGVEDPIHPSTRFAPPRPRHWHFGATTQGQNPLIPPLL